MVDGDAAEAMTDDFVVKASGVLGDVDGGLFDWAVAHYQCGNVGEDGPPDGIGEADVDAVEAEAEDAVLLGDCGNLGVHGFSVGRLICPNRDCLHTRV